MTDTLTWSIAYHDGTGLQEFDEERPDGRGWAERGEKPVAAIMIGNPSHEFDRIHYMLVPPDAKPVFFRRRYVTINAGEQVSDSTGCLAHCIGWKRGDEAVYLFVLEDGSTLLTDDLQAI